MTSDWSVVLLGDFCKKIGSGATPRGGSKVYLEKGETCLIRSQNVHNDGFKPEGLVYITPKDAEKLNNVIVKNGDILLNITGDSVARVCLLKREFIPARVNQHVAIIRTILEEFDPRYLKYQLVSSSMQNRLLSIASIGATRNAITKGMIESLEVRKPPIQIQNQIAGILESIDDKIELNHKTNQTLEQMAQTLFKSWFVDFDPVKAKIAVRNAGGTAEQANLAAMQVVSGKTEAQLEVMKTQQHKQYEELKATAELFTDAMQKSELGDVPVGWEVSDVISEFNITMGQSPSGDTYNEEKNGEPFFQGRRDFGWRYPSNRVYCTAPKRMANKGDTLLSVRAPVGDINKANLHCCIGRGLAAIRHKSGCDAFTYYSIWNMGKSFSSFDAEGTVFGSINQKDLKAIKVIQPTIKLVNYFSNIAGNFDSKILNLSQEIDSLTQLRDTLLPKLLSGELNVSN